MRCQVVDVSQLQHFDRNWDGRNPKEGEKEPTAYRYIILVGARLLHHATRFATAKNMHLNAPWHASGDDHAQHLCRD